MGLFELSLIIVMLVVGGLCFIAPWWNRRHGFDDD